MQLHVFLNKNDGNTVYKAFDHHIYRHCNKELMPIPTQ